MDDLLAQAIDIDTKGSCPCESHLGTSIIQSYANQPEQEVWLIFWVWLAVTFYWARLL